MDLKSFISQPARGADIDTQLSYQYLWMMLLRLVLYTSILGISLFLKSDHYTVIVLPKELSILFLMIIYLTTIGSFYFLIARQFDLRQFGFIQFFIGLKKEGNQSMDLDYFVYLPYIHFIIIKKS